MRKIITAAIVCIALAACSKEQFPILYPEWDSQAPAWAVEACGEHPVVCRVNPRGCCWRGFVCSNLDPDVLPMYRKAGYCNWRGGDMAGAKNVVKQVSR